MNQSALVVIVPEAEPMVGTLRSRFDPSSLIGVPAHITVLFPFIPFERLTAGVLTQLRTVIAGFSEFELGLDRVGRFPRTTYLALAPHAPFVAMTTALVREFPDYPPYGGRFSTPVPHLTVADQNEESADIAARELDGVLESRGAVRATCRAVTLLENSHAGHWRAYESFALKRRT